MDGQEALTSKWGVLGHNAKPPDTRETPWSEGDVLLATSDGVSDAARIFRERHLRFVHPALAAAIILHDAPGKLDDQVVMVIRR